MNGPENLRTWPRAQLSAKVRSELNEWIQTENELGQAKVYLSSTDGKGQLGPLIRSLCELIEQRNQAALAKATMARTANVSSHVGREKRKSSRAGAGSIKPSVGQQMQSMILCKMPPRKEQQEERGSKSSLKEPKKKEAPTPAPLQGMQRLEEEEEGASGGMQEAKAGVEATQPWLLRTLPNVTILLFALGYLLSGALTFRLLDQEMASKPFRWSLILAFETCTTIGWGDSKPSNRWSRAFCTVYTLFGVPILFSSFANIGRLISPLYTVDWLFLTGVVRKKIHVSQHRLPIKRALNLLFLHQFIGVLLYSGLVKDLPVVTAIYFSITSMGTIGIGDFHPDTRNDAEAVLALAYIGSGIILLSALLLSINYFYQAIFFIWLRDKLQAMAIWEWSMGRSRVKAKAQEGQ